MMWLCILLLPGILAADEPSDYVVNPKLAAAHPHPPPHAHPYPPPPPGHPHPPPIAPKAAAPVAPLGMGTGRDKYEPIDPSHYHPEEVNKAGNKADCHAVERLVYEEQCVPYVQKTCYTQQTEQCRDVFEKNCTTVVDAGEKRECFEVTELLCNLVESIKYEMVDEMYTVQRCTRVTDRICDTVTDIAVTTKDDFACVNVDHHYCWSEDKIVKDRTCIFSVDFNCKKDKPKDGKGSVQCEQTPTKNCYDTPRKVEQEICKPRTSKWCEKLTNAIPFPMEKQNCHSDPMKKCELENRTRPKKAKKFVYTKQCKPVKRKVCENREFKKLRPLCDKIQKKICQYKPVERCEEEKKKYCFKAEKKVWEKVCKPDRKEIIDESFSYV